MCSQSIIAKAFRFIVVKFKLLCWNILGRFCQSITISSKQGIFTVLLKDNIISKELFCYGQFELGLFQEAMKFLRSLQKCPQRGEGTILDIGANNGVISLGALYTGEFKNAIAIEPEPQNFSFLQHNVDQNGLKDRFICLPYAASNQKGELSFELSKNNFGDHRVHRPAALANSEAERYHESERRVISVKSDKVDTLLASLSQTFTQSISLIWVDVQGHEGYVFTGAKNLLSKGIPVMSEVWPYGMKRAGMSQEEFCDIAKGIWSHYCVRRRRGFVRYPINTLDSLFDELGYDGISENVLFI
jgi:FkbM family methyltransferase